MSGELVTPAVSAYVRIHGDYPPEEIERRYRAALKAIKGAWTIDPHERRGDGTIEAASPQLRRSV